MDIVLPKFVRKELDEYLECGLLCRGFARLRCSETCKETRLVGFSCKGRGFCPSCLGRKMCATAAQLMDDVMPRAVPLRQWVLTMPFAWRKRLAYDGALWSALTRVFTNVVSRLYGKRCGAVIALQRTSSDMKLNPHIHAVFLDGHYVEQQDEHMFETRSRVSTADVANVLEKTRDKIEQEIGAELQWNPYPDKRMKTIVLNQPMKLHDRVAWPSAIDWLLRTTIAFHGAFAPRVALLDLRLQG